MTIIRMLALISLLAASFALSTDGGGAMDPNGVGSGIDSNCYSACVDPNG
jgi:hypothetical protein